MSKEIIIPEELRQFIHDLASDITVIEGFVKYGLSSIRDKDDIEKGQEFLDKGVDKIKELGNKIREFRDISR